MDFDLERLNFIIVEDNAHMRALLKTVLRALGVSKIMEFREGADALKGIRSFPVDIVITDWEMKPLDGLDFTKFVRTSSDSPNPFVPIIMLTGHTSMKHVNEARDAGVTEFLAKPISAKGLYSRIKTIIQRPRAFVRTAEFFGPDRRRHVDRNYRGEERRQEEVEPTELSEEEIDAILNSAA